MTRQQFDKRLKTLQDKKNVVFRIVFKRRTDKWLGGQLIAQKADERTMVCQFGVKPHDAGDGPNPQRKERDRNNNVITVYELAGDDSGYKCIPVDGVVKLDPAPDLEHMAVLEEMVK